MPFYSYECQNAQCRHVEDQYFPVRPETIPQSLPCVKCGKTAERSYRAEVVQRRAEVEYVTENGGCHPSQIPEFQKEYGDLGVTFRPNGTAVCPNRSTYFKYLERRGFVNFDETRGGKNARNQKVRGRIFG